LRDGEYIVKTVYGFWKQNDTRNPKYLYDNMGISSYTSEHPLMGIDSNGTKGIFTRFNDDIYGNGNTDGLCYNPNTNKKVPYTFTRYVGVKVINGLSFQLEEAPKNPEKFNRGIDWYNRNNEKVGTSTQDLCITKLPYTVKSIAFTNHSGYQNENITVKYSGDISNYSSLTYFAPRYYNSMNFDDFFWWGNLVVTSELVESYDGVGNYNDWLFTVLLDFDIYPLRIGDKPFKYFHSYTENIRNLINFYTSNTMMNLFKKLYNNPLYSKVKEELKKLYPNEDYFELYNTEKNAKVTELAKGYNQSHSIGHLSFDIKEIKIFHYIFNSNPRKEIIDSFITYVNKIAERTKILTYQEVMMAMKNEIKHIVTEYKTRLSSYTSCDSNGDDCTDAYETLQSKIICYKRCKQDDRDTQYIINGSYKYGYDIWKEHNPNTDNSEWEKHKNDEFYINDMINDFVYGLSSGDNGDKHPEADTYYFDMEWITHGIPLK